jgi:hypothetical protein
MTTHFMNHQQAMEQHATERYLLREMSAEERHAFEEHYLECPECLEAVTFGTEFLEAGRQVAQEMKQHGLNTVRVSSWRERLMPVFSGWLRPASALVFAVLLCSVIAYQGIQIHQFKNEQTAKVARPEFRSVLTGIAHGAGEANLVEVPRNAVVSLGIEYNRSGDYVSYRAQVQNEVGSIRQSIDLPDVPGDMANVALLPDNLNEGEYTLIILGRTADGSEKEVGRRAFNLKFSDK